MVQTHGRPLGSVTNSSGAEALTGHVGYLDEAGEYQTTTTAYDAQNWHVVVGPGANGAEIYVVNRGVVTVRLNGNCSAGDYLYTSSTAGQAQPESYVRAEVFAVALTANADGTGGTCQARLLCDSVTVPLDSSNEVYRTNTANGTLFTATINGAPVGAAVVYAIVTGDETCIDNSSSSELAKLRLYNSTRTSWALISSVNTGTNTITVTAAADIATWQNGDSLTCQSQTNTDATYAIHFFEYEVTSSDVPELARSIGMDLVHLDSAAAGVRTMFHPVEIYAGAKVTWRYTEVAGVVLGVGLPPVPLIDRRFCMKSQANGAGTKTTAVSLKYAEVAAP